MTVKYDRINDEQTCNDLNPMISKQRSVSLSQPVIMYVCHKVYKHEQAWTGTKIQPWTFWSRPDHYNPCADTVPTNIDVHLNTQALNNSSILNNIPYILET